MKRITLCLLTVVLSLPLFAQQLYLPLNNDANSLFAPGLNRLDSRFHTSVRPYLATEVENTVKADSLTNAELYILTEGKRSLLYRKVRKENLVQVDSGDFHLTINPLFNAEFGKDLVSDTSTHINARGITFNGSIGTKFSFSSTFYENQGVFVPYLDTYIRKNYIVPGQGYKRDFKNGFDFGMASGYISYSPSKYFNFQFGHDKIFIGDGYRSLLLSDNSFNYPFLKITTTIWKLKYVNIWAEMTDITNPIFQGAGHYYKKKYTTMHYLSYNVTKRLNIGLFETVIWQAKDTLGNRNLDFNYLNPVVFYRPVEFSIGSPDNVLLGLNMKFKINNTNSLYGQVILDEFKLSEIKSNKGWYGNKQGFQLGLKSFNLFTVKNLSFQTEYNLVKPYTYSEAIPIINYAHYNQPLAHPLGSNFKESVSFLRYRYKSIYGVIKFMYTIHGSDTAGENFGNNVYKPYLSALPKHEYGNYIGSGLEKTLIYKDFRIGYIVNPKTNLNIEVGISSREEKDKFKSVNTTFIYLGIRTSLTNFYYDF